MDIQRVKVLARMTGDYAAFHEASIYVLYDFTNHKSLGEFSLSSKFKDEWFTDEDREEIKEEFIPEIEAIAKKYKEESDGYSDYEVIDAFLIEGCYYYRMEE